MGPPAKGHAYSLLKFRHDRISSFQGIRVWNFRRSGLKVLFTPQNLSFWGVLPPKFRGTSFRPPKYASLRDFTSNELSRVKIHQDSHIGSRSVRETIRHLCNPTFASGWYDRSLWKVLYKIRSPNLDLMLSKIPFRRGYEYKVRNKSFHYNIRKTRQFLCCRVHR